VIAKILKDLVTELLKDLAARIRLWFKLDRTGQATEKLKGAQSPEEKQQAGDDLRKGF
jgi:hypothetical protein